MGFITKRWVCSECKTDYVSKKEARVCLEVCTEVERNKKQKRGKRDVNRSFFNGVKTFARKIVPAKRMARHQAR